VVKYSFDRADFEKMRYVLGSNDWDFLLQSKSANEQWSIISREIEKAVNTVVPHKMYINKEQCRRKPPWTSHRVMAKIKRKQSTCEQFILTRAGHEYTEYVKARNTATNELRRAVREYEKEVACLAKKNSTVFYRHVNGKMKPRPVVGDLKMDNEVSWLLMFS